MSPAAKRLAYPSLLSGKERGREKEDERRKERNMERKTKGRKESRKIKTKKRIKRRNKEKRRANILSRAPYTRFGNAFVRRERKAVTKLNGSQKH